ncbi:integrase catalytic domain-containing protein [Trichonephila clavipes]|nr:integrase catalytic domain-containing protein [Trichonephila clavipes]
MASGKLEAYEETFDSWLNLSIIEKISQGEIGGTHYLPHRPVIKPGSTTSIRKDDLERVQEYRHRRVVLGLTCSPYLLAATL